MPEPEPDPRPEPESAERGSGATFLAEIREQPAALSRLLERQEDFHHVAALMHQRGARTIRIVGHGSSDNAASFGVYAFGLGPRWTAFRDSISLTVHYGSRLDFTGATVLALSQSGRTPDVLEYVERSRAAGAFTVALTNEPDSELAEAAEAVLPLEAGSEHAVAATKTYLNQIAALLLLAAHLAGTERRYAGGIRLVSEELEGLIPDLERRVVPLAASFAFTGRMFVIGRGAEFATAREIALKLLETTRIAA
ncbi:MAG TPA: SIS domain-containing protein, partial [Gaiellaceae bacterium]|nr:SIS domain-containing protein [Gaiellaceae bacterium]